MTWGETSYTQSEGKDKLKKKAAVSPSRPLNCSVRRYLSLNFSRIQIGFHKSNRALNNFTRAFIVSLIIKTVNALRMVSNGQGDIFGEGFADEAINRIVHCRNCVESGAGDKNRRDFLGIFCQVID